MAKVKDYQNWERIFFPDRTILKCDIKYMSWEQIKALDNLDVALDEDNGKTLRIENRGFINPVEIYRVYCFGQLLYIIYKLSKINLYILCILRIVILKNERIIKTVKRN